MARGSIQKRTGKRGVTWTAVVDVGVGADGKRKQKRISATTRREVERQMSAILTEVERGSYVDVQRMTFGEYLDGWWAVARTSIQPTSEKQYRTVVKRARARLGSLRLAQLKPEHIEGFYAELMDQGLSPSTIRLYHAVLNRALGQAVRRRYLPSNPCTFVDKPRVQRTEMHVWTAAQAQTFLAGTRDDALYPVWLVLLTTGMRRGEVLGLRWRDIDLDGAVVSISRNLGYGRDVRWELREPKTSASRRSIPIPGAVADALRQVKAAQDERKAAIGDGWDSRDFVFDRGDGLHLDPDAVTARFNQLVSTLGLPAIRLHDLRHTSATLMLKAGVHPKVAQERLGHSSVRMTLDLYSHTLEGMQRDVSDLLAETLDLTPSRDQFVTKFEEEARKP